MTTEIGRLGVWTWLDGFSAPEAADFANQIEEWGYSALWIPEAVGRDPFPLIGYLAARTTELVFATGIANIYARDAMTSKALLKTCGELAPGRFVLGLGTSSHAMIEGWHGIPFEQPLGRIRDTMAVLRSAFAGEKTGYEGSTLTSQGFRLGVRVHQPVKIYLAALREKMLELAGALGEGLIINMMPLQAMPQIMEAYRSGALDAERDASGDDVVARFQIAVTDDKERARNMVRMGFSGYVATPVYNRFFSWVGHEDVARGVAEAFANGDRQGTAAAMSDTFVEDLAIIGDAVEAREKLAAFVAAGVTTPVLAPLAASPEETIAVLETFAPALQP